MAPGSSPGARFQNQPKEEFGAQGNVSVALRIYSGDRPGGGKLGEQDDQEKRNRAGKLPGEWGGRLRRLPYALRGQRSARQGALAARRNPVLRTAATHS